MLQIAVGQEQGDNLLLFGVNGAVQGGRAIDSRCQGVADGQKEAHKLCRVGGASVCCEN